MCKSPLIQFNYWQQKLSKLNPKSVKKEDENGYRCCIDLAIQKSYKIDSESDSKTILKPFTGMPWAHLICSCVSKMCATDPVRICNASWQSQLPSLTKKHWIVQFGIQTLSLPEEAHNGSCIRKLCARRIDGGRGVYSEREGASKASSQS